MRGSVLEGIGQRALLGWLLLFFTALAVPAAVLVGHAYSQLKWEAFHHYRVLAEEFAQRMDSEFGRLIESEEARSFADYGFLVVAGDPAANFVQRSPLSGYPISGRLPGTIGYFQVDSDGILTTPLLPDSDSVQIYGIPADEYRHRLSLQNRILEILSQNRLVQGGALSEKRRSIPKHVPSVVGSLEAKSAQPEQAIEPVDEPQAVAESPSSIAFETTPAPQADFDRLKRKVVRSRPEKKRERVKKLGRVEDLKLDYRYQDAVADRAREKVGKTNRGKVIRSTRKERSALPEADKAAMVGPNRNNSAQVSGLRITTFESSIDPFEFSLLDSGQLVLYRKVWRDGQRIIQGILLDRKQFFERIIKPAFEQTTLSKMSDLIVAYAGDVVAVFDGQDDADRSISSAGKLDGALLYSMRFSSPLSDVELIFSIKRLPAGPGSRVIVWTAIVLGLVLCGGFVALYRLGVRQIELARQQQDFISAVSHELKTPLTSIRMYGEMLREGWVGEKKKKSYYDYIFFESERLSRLITNVLQLARMTRNGADMDLKSVSVLGLMDSIVSKVNSQTERAGFELNVDCDRSIANVSIRVDTDQFMQVMINLVDNAIKFSAKADLKRIDVSACRGPANHILFAVRDYGAGIARNQMKKIFRLFYRSENELTRETVGTGIGLALVHQLVTGMGGSVTVTNRQPGAEFSLSFPVQKSD